MHAYGIYARPDTRPWNTLFLSAWSHMELKSIGFQYDGEIWGGEVGGDSIWLATNLYCFNVLSSTSKESWILWQRTSGTNVSLVEGSLFKNHETESLNGGIQPWSVTFGSEVRGHVTQSTYKYNVYWNLTKHSLTHQAQLSQPRVKAWHARLIKHTTYLMQPF